MNFLTIRKTTAFLSWFFLLITSLPQTALSHPHAFVEAEVTVVFNAEGLAGFREKWSLDPMVTMSILEFAGADMDGTLSEPEKTAIEEKCFPNLGNYNYFTEIKLNGERFDLQEVTDFKASMSGPKLIYEFFVPCHMKAVHDVKEAKIALYDESFYTYIAYGDESGASIDPTQDPLFYNTDAPASSEDFQRFSQAVGLESYKGKIKLEGPAEIYTIESDVSEAPEMAYFHEQIVPEAFKIRFKLK